MRNILFTALAAAVVVAVGTSANATAPASAATVGAARADAAPVQVAAVICGGNGCAMVQTKRIEHPKKLQYIR